MKPRLTNDERYSLAVACPKCRRSMGFLCRTKLGRKTARPHMRRVKLWRDREPMRARRAKR